MASTETQMYADWGVVVGVACVLVVSTGCGDTDQRVDSPEPVVTETFS